MSDKRLFRDYIGKKVYIQITEEVRRTYDLYNLIGTFSKIGDTFIKIEDYREIGKIGNETYERDMAISNHDKNNLDSIILNKSMIASIKKVF